MKRMIILTVSLSCLIFFCFSHTARIQEEGEEADSQIEFVRKFFVDATNGNDGNNGRSETSAWKTLGKIRSRSFSPGDAILLKRGESWRGTLILERSSGSEDLPITIGAYGTGEKPQITGATTASGWSRDRAAIFQKSFSHEPKVVVQNKKLLAYLRWKTDVVTTFKGASPGSWAAKPKSRRAYVWCTDSADPDTHNMEVAAVRRDDTHEHGIRIKNVSNIVVQDIAIINTSQNGILVRPASGQRTNNIILRRLTIYNTGAKGIGFNNARNPKAGQPEILGAIVAFCEIYDTAGHGIILSYGVSGAKIRNNTLYRIGWSQTGSHGISSWSKNGQAIVHDCVIEKNIVYETIEAAGTGAEGAGIQADDYTKDCIYRYNISYNNEGSGFYFHGTSGCNFFYNLSYGNGHGTKSSHNFRGGITLSHPINVKVYNNVCFDNYPTGIGWWGGNTNGLSIQNNIVSKNANYEIRSGVNAGRNVFCDYNCVHHPAGGTFLRWLGNGMSWMEWKNLPGQHNHSIRRNPLFRNTGMENFELKLNSPCIDRGIGVGLKKDRHGNVLPLGSGVDMGASESTGPNPK